MKISNELKNLYDQEEAENIAVLILEKISGFERSDQILQKEIILSSEQLENINSILNRLYENEPIQYVLEESWFAGLKFKVNKNVLIPRPETEELVDWVCNEVGSHDLRTMNILDVGTGSGCIPISLKKKLPKSKVTAIDLSSEALIVANENANILGADIDFIHLDFLNIENWTGLGKYDIIISNPPYVLQKEKETMHQRVISHEPTLALFVPDNDGLIFYKKLAAFSLFHLNENGKLFVEINESCGSDVVKLFQSKGLSSVALRKDMQGKDRMVRGVLSY
jgi:release factor glutamine methyltransferase